VFVVMMLNLGRSTIEQERQWLTWRVWLGPAILWILMLVELMRTLTLHWIHPIGATEISPVQVGVALFGPYLLAVELASMLLLAGLVTAFHLGRHDT
jgi:NADH-quinone oxidoreductase subunit J